MQSKPVKEITFVPHRSTVHPSSGQGTLRLEGANGLAIIWVWGGKQSSTMRGTKRGSSQSRLWFLLDTAELNFRMIVMETKAKHRNTME
jgi:hypothetical protein